MKYILLIYDTEKKFRALPKADMDAMMTEYRAFGESITKSGNKIAGHQLHDTDAATSLRIRDGRLQTIDGPFAETKEQLGGFYLIEAKDLNEALAIGARIPSVKYGTIEVRPIVEH
jgi:hypothetical protein